MKKFLHRIAPFLNNGKWYKFFIEVNDGSYKITTKERACSISGTSLKIPNAQVIDYILDIHNDTASVTSVDKSIKLFADGSQGVALPSTSCTDYFTVWVFCKNI